jgi:hypothetical protein
MIINSTQLAARLTDRHVRRHHHRPVLTVSCILLAACTQAVAASSPEFGFRPIDTNYTFDPFDVQPVDMDDDGDMDFISGATFFGDGQLSWWENDGAGAFMEHMISGAGNFWVVWPVDIDNDDDFDILTERDWETRDYRLTVWINDGAQGFSPQDLLVDPSSTVCAREVSVADVDSDGDADIICQRLFEGQRVLAWLENQGALQFAEHPVGGEPYRHWAADADGDGDIDLFTGSSVNAEQPSQLRWWENDGNQGFTMHVIGAVTPPDVYVDINGAFINADGTLDLLTAVKVTGGARGRALWYENLGGGAYIERVVAPVFSEVSAIDSADFDGDGYTDLVVNGYFGSTIRWYRGDGLGGFSAATITSASRGTNEARPVDLDGDGDVDLLTQAFFQNDIVWWENLGSLFLLLPPLRDGGTYLTGRTLPVWFQLFDEFGDPRTDLAAMVRVTDAGGAQKGMGPTRIIRGDTYYYRFSTRALTAGEYTITVEFSDGRSDSIDITLQ